MLSTSVLDVSPLESLKAEYKIGEQQQAATDTIVVEYRIKKNSYFDSIYLTVDYIFEDDSTEFYTDKLSGKLESESFHYVHQYSITLSVYFIVGR